MLVLPLIGGSYEGLRPPMGEFFRRISTHAPELGLRPLSDQQIEALAEFVVAALPGALAAYWIGHLHAQPLSRRPHRARLRPARARLAGPAGDDLPAGISRCSPCSRSRLPSRPERSGVAGTSFTGALLFAYLIAGLALMHCIARGRWPWILWIVYAGLLLFGPYMALALIVAGLLDPALKLKRRFGGLPPAT